MSNAALDRLGALSDAACAGLIDRFRAAGFTDELVNEAARFAPGLLLGPRLPLLRWWLSQRPEPGARLARLFTYEEPLPAAEAREALGAELADALVRAGILAPSADGAELAARFMITPTALNLWLLSDSLEAGRDAVMGPGSGTEYIARLVPARLGGTALDVGCGAGTLALVAARAGARRAVGVDINERAVEIARFNARLNGLAAEFRVGDGVAPVSGEAFDLVLSQPPFVVRPAGGPDYTFLFGGAEGDELPRRLLREIAPVLAPGGRALMLLQAPMRDDLSTAARMRAALAEAPVDLLSIGMEAPSLATQASVFGSLEDPTLGASYHAAVHRYLDHFAAQGIREFDAALIVLGRPSGPVPQHYTLGMYVAHLDYDAATLDRYLRGLDLVSSAPEALADARLRVSPHAALSMEVSKTAAGAEGQPVIRVAAPGIGATWHLDTNQLAVLKAIATAPRVADAIRALAPDAREQSLDLVREGLAHGVLERHDDPGAG
jgi:SAM-dependent methyltransferase